MFKKIIIFIIFSMLIFLFSCKKSTINENKKNIKGTISFFDELGNPIDSLVNASIQLYALESIVDSISNLQSQYPNVFSSFDPIFLTDFRLSSKPIMETQTSNNFEFSNVDEEKFLLVYSADGFGWHYLSVNKGDTKIKLNMRREIIINSGISQEDITWGPDQFIHLSQNFYSYGKLTIEKNTVIALENSKIYINADIETNGVSNQPILFTSNYDTPKSGDWSGLEIANTSQNCKLNYTILSWANFALRNNGKIDITNSAILSSWTGINSTSAIINVESSLFHNCQKGIQIFSTDALSSQPQIKNNIFISNSNIACEISGSSPQVTNNIFMTNYTDIYLTTEGGHSHSGTTPNIAYCLFENSNNYSIYSSRSGPTISFSNFSNNRNILYLIACHNTNRTVVNNCNFIDCKSYYIPKLFYRSGGNEVNMEDNWWETTTESDIQNKIYDENDEPGGNNVGYVDYTPWKTHKIVDAGPK